MTDKTTATKKDIARRLWREYDDINWDRDYPPHAREIVGSVLDAIASELAEKGRVEIRGTGVFHVEHTPARTARNLQTGEPMRVPPKARPRWQPSSVVEKAVEAANEVSAD